MVDTNSDPSDIEFPIPANDDASKSISLIVGLLCDAIEEGLNERKLEKDKEPAAQKERKVTRKNIETKDLSDSVIEDLAEEEEEETGEEEEDFVEEDDEIAADTEEDDEE